MPDVALEMDCGHELITGDYTCSYSYAYRSLMGTGTICEVTDPEEKVHGLNLLMQHMETGGVHPLPSRKCSPAWAFTVLMSGSLPESKGQ